MKTNYAEFIDSKRHSRTNHGFDPIWMPNELFDFQHTLTEFAIQKGRCAVFADCGLGKTPQQLTWAENVVRHTNRPVLIVTPLAVGHQTIKEGEKFGIECVRSSDGKFPTGARVVVTNYERLHHFNPDDFAGFAGDESSAIKNFDGKRRAIVTEFMRTMAFRSLWTATAAPNDYIELGTTSEALGELGHVDMLGRFFANDQGNSVKTNRNWEGSKWRFKAHAAQHFWRWVCSWARACRKPSDLGFDDGRFQLPPLIENEHVVVARRKREGFLFDLTANGLREEREERRRTIQERCERIAELATHDQPAVIWCHLNDEGDLIEKLIPDAQQVSGRDSDDAKEEKFRAFGDGQLRALITKPKIGAWGLNWQHCAHVLEFPSHSFEQRYQAIRRCWRFGQTRPVTVDTVSSEGEAGILGNLRRKQDQADAMFAELIAHMNDALRIEKTNRFTNVMEIPSWLSKLK